MFYLFEVLDSCNYFILVLILENKYPSEGKFIGFHFKSLPKSFFSPDRFTFHFLLSFFHFSFPAPRYKKSSFEQLLRIFTRYTGWAKTFF